MLPLFFNLQKSDRENGFPTQVPKLETSQREEILTPFMNREEDPLTLSGHTCPKHTDGGALGVAHIVESLLSSFLYNKIDCGWKIILSHLIQTAKGKKKQNWKKYHC